MCHLGDDLTAAPTRAQKKEEKPDEEGGKGPIQATMIGAGGYQMRSSRPATSRIVISPAVARALQRHLGVYSPLTRFYGVLQKLK